MKRLLFVPPRLVLPLMIFVSVLIMGARVGDVWSAVSSGRILDAVQSAHAEEKKQSDPQNQTAEPKKDLNADKRAQEKASQQSAPTPREPSTPEGDLYRQLQGRRDQLDKRAEELDSREVMIKIAEQRVDTKLQELETLRSQLQKLLGQASAAQQQQIENLVKIYETMKPKDAAKIFETLEMPVLLGVVQRMKPARTAPIMAEMDPQKAKDITVALTKQDQLPQIK